MTATEAESDTFKKLNEFGRFQIYQYILICLPLFMVSMAHVNYVFVAEDVNYRCRVPECDGTNATVETPSWWPDNADPKCLRPMVNMDKYNLDNQTCSNTSFYELVEECHDWIYESNNSIVAELNLGCQSWKATLVGSIHNAGMIVSMMFAGWMADRIGRKPTTIICAVGGCVGLAKIFLTNYYAYIAVEFLESIIESGLYTVGIVLMIEVGGETKRVLTGVIFSYAVYVGEIFFAFVAMGLHYWKSLTAMIYAPMFIFVIYGLLLKESTRWQMIQGKMSNAKSTFKAMAKMNKIDITDKEIDDMDDKELESKFNVEAQKQKEDIKVILNSREMMLRLAVTSVCFFTSSFVYYGLVVHSVLLPGDKYTNFILSSLTSFPGELITYFAFNKFGRRISLQCGYIFCGVALMAESFSPDSIVWLKIVLFLCGKLGVVICFTGVYTYALELFPTSVRGSLFGFGNTTARIGSMLAPLTPLLKKEFTSLPSILFSSTTIISALLLSFTPETKFLPMFDTIAQVEAYHAKTTTRL